MCWVCDAALVAAEADGSVGRGNREVRRWNMPPLVDDQHLARCPHAQAPANGACHLRSTSAEQFAAGAGQVARRRRPVTHACIEAIPIPGLRLTLLTRRQPTGGEQSDDRRWSSTSLSR